jgi:hypothetical protein
MTPVLPHYLNGGEVHAGDRVRYKGASAKVVFVSDGDNGEFAPGYADYLGHEPGIMLCEDEENEMVFISEPDEDLELVARKPSV